MIESVADCAADDGFDSAIPGVFVRIRRVRKDSGSRKQKGVPQ
jgi:hypothetical protein